MGAIMIVNDPAVLAEITPLFERYERALMADDVAAMDLLFHDAQTTIRFGVGEVLYGAEAIRNYRKGRGGSPQRSADRTTVTTYGRDTATTHVEFSREGSDRRGRQSQTWIRFPEGWKVVAAHVSMES